MMTTVRAVVRDGQIMLLEPVDLIDGTQVLVTVPTEVDDIEFLRQASEQSFAAIWDNPEDDEHGELLKG
jgi:hypothetical protein